MALKDVEIKSLHESVLMYLDNSKLQKGFE